MKKVVLILSAVVLAISFVACKNDKTSPEITGEIPEETIVENSEDIAFAETSEINETLEPQFLYVIAPSGLSLREYNNLQSEKLARMPYGTKVKVLTKEENATMTVGGIKGGMHEVEFNHKKGFAFNGYLSKYFPPDRDITVKGYADELQRFFPEVIYSSETSGTASNPINTESIYLPGSQWNDGFNTAQRLFDFPREFSFPNPKGKNSETIFDGKPKKGIWVSQLEVTRENNTLQKIEYVYGSKKYNSTVSIVKEGDGIKISRVEEIK